MKVPMAFKTNPPMKAILPIKSFINPTIINRTSTVMKRPTNIAIIPKINSIIISVFLFKYNIEQSRLISFT